MILYNVIDVKMPEFPKRKITNWIKEVAAGYNNNIGDISYIFCSNEKILELNIQYLSHNYFTDIITFDYSEKCILAGDIFISLDMVRSNAEKFKVQYQEELFRVIIHGILHLCGIRDKSTKDSVRMKNCENEALQSLNLVENAV